MNLQGPARVAKGNAMAGLLELPIKWFFTVHDTAFTLVAILLWIADAVLTTFIVKHVPYTEIDWSTYMQQVALYNKGERNYTLIGGDTGPCVYPAGFLVLFQILSNLTDGGTNIARAQTIFSVLYLVNLALVFRLYFKSKQIAPFVLVFLSLTGHRIHSIFVLRLFNDPLAMLLFYVAANFFVSQRWVLGCIVYSLAVSIKMNVLLFAPALFFLLLLNKGLANTIWYIGICGIVQLSIGIPFLSRDAFAYLSRSFDLSRVFFYKWTVNWRMLPEDVFLDQRLHIALLFLHIAAVAFFATKFWFRTHGGLVRSVHHLAQGICTRIGVSDALYAFFTANLAGIVFARSLHYQFYSWYFHQLPFLLFVRTVAVDGRPPWVAIVWKSAVLLTIEYTWNTYPSTVLSSTLLHVAHAVIIIYLFLTRRPIDRPTQKKLF